MKIFLRFEPALTETACRLLQIIVFTPVFGWNTIETPVFVHYIYIYKHHKPGVRATKLCKSSARMVICKCLARNNGQTTQSTKTKGVLIRNTLSWKTNFWLFSNLAIPLCPTTVHEKPDITWKICPRVDKQGDYREIPKGRVIWMCMCSLLSIFIPN